MSNSLTISGNVGQDSELKDVGANKVLNFNVGSNVNIKTDDGYQDKPIWYQVALWGRQGEALAQYIKKGTPVTVFGEITDAAGYVDKANIAHSSIRVKAHNIKLHGSKSNGKAENKVTSDDSPNDDIPF
tara:strand:+ start:530 stop:916 length:387 start_codon:yes stop_codon:yes gene_type:complete